MASLVDRIQGRRARLAASIAVAALSAACATTTPAPMPQAAAQPYKVGKPYQVRGVWYTPKEDPGYDETGLGSWYGEQFHNRHTANGEVFDMNRLSAAHKTLPLPCLVEVTNLDNGRKLVIRINDRGPFVEGRIIDLSRAAARDLGYEGKGVARVRVRYVGPAPIRGMNARTYRASAPPAPSRPARAPYRIQAGAFSDRQRAEAAVQVLSSEGRVEIVPLDRGGVTLYRVQVSGEGQAVAVRDRVAALGYADARVMDGF